MNDLRQKLLAAFQVEHRDHLEALRGMLDRLEAADWDREAVDLVEAHRRVHSLKGAARAVDLRPVEALAHRLESLVESCQGGDLPLDGAIARLIRQALDATEDSVAGDNIDDHASELSTIAATIDDVLADTGSAATVLARGERARARAASPTPASQASADATTATPAAPSDSMRVDVGALNSLLQSSSEVLATSTQQERLAAGLRAVERQVQALAAAHAALRAQLRHGLADARPGTADDGKLQAFDVQLEALARHVRSLSVEQRHHARRMHQLGGRLDAQMRQVRMIPASGVFGDARKMLRDLARDQGKKVRVEVRGLESRADREVLQNLRDPILHLLRNAVAHGAELPGERARAGKAPEARIVFELATQGSHFLVAIEDDGPGIDVAGLRRVAAERGMSLQDDPERLDQRAITALLVQPGVTTLRELTEIAGRGMGLSVVDQAVRRLQGELRIEPRPGGGTKVVLAVPISVSGKRLLLVDCAGEMYCIPSHGIDRLQRLQRQQIETIEGRTVIASGDGRHLPIVPLAHLLGHSAAESLDEDQVLAAVLRSGEAQLAVVVDAARSVFDGLIRDVAVAGHTSELLAGGVVMESGAVLPVLNVPALVAAQSSDDVRWQFRPVASQREVRPPNILVVDDSLTTRALEKSVLEANGYRVRLSVDGLDALEQLHAEPADLVVVDVEMPRMDGFELTRSMKAHQELRAIPVILVTSRDTDEDKRRGLSAGADAYIVKQRFDQRELLDTIGQLL